jgi:hypothetical protein
MSAPRPTLATFEEFITHYEKSDEAFKRELFVQYSYAVKERERHRLKAMRRWARIRAARPPDQPINKGGRPRKEKPAPTEPKKPRGRPRKNPVESSGQVVEVSA